MKLLLGVLFSILLLGCESLRYSTADDGPTVAAKAAGRAVQCVVTFCLSEVHYAVEDDQAARTAAYTRWFQSLSPEERQWEHERELARIQAAGMILQGFALRPMIPQPSTPAYQPIQTPVWQQPLRCYHNYEWTTCY